MRQNYPSIFFCILFTGLMMAGCSENKPTQKQQIQIAVHSMFEEGTMVELWEPDDQLDFRRQLGLIPE